MAEATKKSKIKFLGSWIGINLAGWGIGVFSGLCLGEFYLAPYFLSYRSIPRLLMRLHRCLYGYLTAHG